MKDLIVTGTDTGVGKTVVSSLIALKFRLDYWKPVQTGPSPTDSDWVGSIVGRERVHPEAYRLHAPLSPHAAAALEGERVSVAAILRRRPERPCVIEGAGGVLVPINETDLLVDFFSALSTPLILVARSGLGTINHTLLTLEALRRRGLSPLGVVLTGDDNPGNEDAIEAFGQTRVIARIPRLKSLDRRPLLELAEKLEVHL